MNLDEYNFNVPDFVRSASPDSFDVNDSDAVVVGGFRIDNPAAAWVAGAAVRKMASEFDSSMLRMIKQACELFSIGDEMFDTATITPTISISDGTHSAEFCIYDNETLNKAASDLIANRPNLPYSFAHDCAVALRAESSNQGLSFSQDVVVPIRKLAGDYNVDFVAGRELLNRAVSAAESYGMSDHAKVLSKIASMCNEDCSPDAAPYFIVALDEFYRAVPGVRKSASADEAKLPEDVFYMSTAEYKAKADAVKLDIDSKHNVSKATVAANATNISKWAAACGYSIPTNASPQDVVSAVSKMPSALRDEFVELFA